MLSRIALAAALAGVATMANAAPSRSVYGQAPADPRAVTVAGKGDGRADDSSAIQAALDEAAGKGAGGIVFLPAGRYRITRTLYIWPGVRLFGVGRTRPVIELADRTPGFDKGVANMVIFAGAKPGPARATPDWSAGARGRVPFPPPGSVPFRPDIADANPGTFYSALSNVDFRIGKGNAGAAAIRFHAAQHAYLSHIDFELGSGLAGLYQVANEAEDLHFHGGRYGILTEKPSPAWQFTLVDSTFDGQRESAIREHEAQLTLVNVAFRRTPVGVDIDQGYGDWLWGKDVRFDHIARAGVIVSNEKSPLTAIGFENALATAMPTFVRMRDSGKVIAGAGASYRVATFTHGVVVPGLGQMGEIRTDLKADKLPRLPAPRTPALRALPPVDTWANVRDLGAKGDESADDTAAIQHAIDTHRTVYFPAGRYRVTDTLRLRPDTVLVGLHPSLTQILLPDRTTAYQGVGAAKALIESAVGGNAIVTGLGLSTGGINPRATALLWHAGADSLVDDVKFQGGHGTDLADGTRADPYNANHTGDPDPAKRWDAQYPSLWVQGGGGTFAKLWSPTTYAQAGFAVSDTDVPGHVYELSNEHHVRTEITLDHVRHWEFLAPQTEEEAGESGDAVSMEIRDSHDVTVANYHAYRVTRSLRPAPTAVRLYGENDLHFRNMQVNAESGFATCDEGGCATFLRVSKFPYENAIQDATHRLEVREREFASLDVTPHPATPAPAATVATKLADGFFSASGGAVDAAGTLYFTDRWRQRIYRYDAGGLGLVSDHALDPVNLAVDRSGDLMVLSSDGRNGTVYSLKPGSDAITLVPPTPAAPHADATAAIPTTYWNNGEFKDQLDPSTYRFTTLAEMFARDAGQARPTEYVSPDGSLVLPAYRTFIQGPPDFRGWRFSDALDTHGFTLAQPGTRVFVSNASEDRTYSALLGAGGALSDLKPFADRGGESVATDSAGRVYVANGQVFIYAPDGSPAGRIDVPERPLQLLFGGEGRRTLYILTHHALYATTPPG